MAGKWLLTRLGDVVAVRPAELAGNGLPATYCFADLGSLTTVTTSSTSPTVTAPQPVVSLVVHRIGGVKRYTVQKRALGGFLKPNNAGINRDSCSVANVFSLLLGKLLECPHCVNGVIVGGTLPTDSSTSSSSTLTSTSSTSTSYTAITTTAATTTTSTSII
ncbi:hypothetical protein ColKHC_09400 [Colletotrichum higginsianum]|nr:hypothetical protein ColKHC_09400 [Colletotrichum higginsianum]